MGRREQSRQGNAPSGQRPAGRARAAGACIRPYCSCTMSHHDASAHAVPKERIRAWTGFSGVCRADSRACLAWQQAGRELLLEPQRTAAWARSVLTDSAHTLRPDRLCCIHVTASRMTPSAVIQSGLQALHACARQAMSAVHDEGDLRQVPSLLRMAMTAMKAQSEPNLILEG